MYVYNRAIGICMILAGFGILIFILSAFLLRIFLTFFALWMIKHGLRLVGSSMVYHRMFR